MRPSRRRSHEDCIRRAIGRSDIDWLCCHLPAHHGECRTRRGV